MISIGRFSFAGIASFLLAYATLTGCMWHLGYWSTFKFNFLEYANVSDLFKSTIYPFFSATWYVVVIFVICGGITLGFSLTVISSERSERKEPLTDLSKPLLGIAFSFSALSFAIYSGFLWDVQNQTIAAVSAAVFIASLLFLSGIFKNEIKDGILRWLLFVSILMVPAISYGVAKKESTYAKWKIRYHGVMSVNSPDSALKSSVLNTVYLGNANNRYFFFDSIRVLVVNSEKIHSLSLEYKTDDSNYAKWLKQN